MIPQQPNPTSGPRDETQLADIWGSFPQVTSTPTWTPKTFRDSFAINTSKATMYYYDFLNNVWRVMSGNAAYGGYVDPTASSPNLPTGWSVAVNGSTKVYTVTHNLGTTAYAVVATAIDSNSVTYYHPSIVRNSNTFTVEFDNSSGSAGETDWMFTLVPIV